MTLNVYLRGKVVRLAYSPTATATGAVVKPTTVAFRVIDPLGTVATPPMVDDGPTSGYHADYAIPTSAPKGVYRAEVVATNPADRAEGEFVVESIFD
jgi:uncharacterized protein YfaS (alpha-2-macroglobulin family)